MHTGRINKSYGTKPARFRLPAGVVCLLVCFLGLLPDVHAKLIHRWSFTEVGGPGTTLIDSIGNEHSIIVDVGENNADVGISYPGQVYLTGGTNPASDYVKLPNGVFSSLEDATIELWVTQRGLKNWMRMFSLGSSTADVLLMTFVQGTTDSNDIIQWIDNGVTRNASGKMGTYLQDMQIHVVMTIDQDDFGGDTVVTCYKDRLCVNSGTPVFTTPNKLSQLNDVDNTLGRSKWTNDDTANASYNEMRVYDHVLTQTEVDRNYFARADAPDNGVGATAITMSEATLNGSIVSTNEDIDVWVFWGPTNEDTNKATWATNVYLGRPGPGPISYVAGGLIATTQHYYVYYQSNVAWQAWSISVADFKTLDYPDWSGYVDDLWSNTNNWGGRNVPDQPGEWAVFNGSGVGDVDLNEGNYLFDYILFTAGGYTITDPNEIKGSLTLGTMTNFAGVNTIAAEMTVTGALVAAGGTVVLSDAAEFNAGKLVMAGGNVDLLGELKMSYGKLYLWGYELNNGMLHNLNGNGGLLVTVPTHEVYFTMGPGNRGLDFNSDQEWFDSGAISQNYWDNYMNMIHGFFNAQETGSHEFKIANEDDVGIIWIDLDLNGVFEHAGAKGDEQIVYDGNHNTVTRLLIGGKSYKFAVTHQEFGGGSGIEVLFKAPSMSGQTMIKPGDPAQSAYWSVGSYNTLAGDGVPIDAISNGVLRAWGDPTVLGSVSVSNGATLEISGSDAAMTVKQAAIAGNIVITACDMLMTNVSYAASSSFRINESASLTVKDPFVVDTLLAYGPVFAPGPITGATKLSFGAGTITNKLTGTAEVWYGEMRSGNIVVINTMTNDYSGDTVIQRATLVADEGFGLPMAGDLVFSSQADGEIAVLETKGSFSRMIGDGQGIYWAGRGGFSARGGPLDVSLTLGGQIVWSDPGGFNDKTLYLNSETADNVVNLKNPINIGLSNRNIFIYDNNASKNDMAIISGNITGGDSSKWLYKRYNGLLWLTGTNTFAHRIFMEDCGPLRGDDTIGIPWAASFRFDQGNMWYPSVWEAKGAINRTIGDNGVAGKINWQNGHGGFSAYGGKLTVTLNSGAQIDWGGNYTNGFNNKVLQFCSYYSDNEVEFVNPIDMTTGQRDIIVFDNTDTNTDFAVLSGVINGNNSGTFFRKFGPGILWLKNTNLYNQCVWIDDGIIRADDGAGLPVGATLRMEQGNWDNPGVLETKGTFTRSVGNGAGQVYWQENGGFAAYGGPLAVNLGGAGAAINVGSYPDGLNTRQLQLGSRSATHPVDFQNGLYFVNRAWQIRAFDNPDTTNDYVIISGNYSYSGWGDAEIKGDAIVRLTGSNVMRQLRLYNTVKVLVNNLWDSSDYIYTVDNPGGSIGGNGEIRVANWMDVRTGGFLTPGDGVGTLNLTVTRTGPDYGFQMWDGSTYECELGGSDNDKLALTGDLVLDDMWTLKLIDRGAAPKASGEYDIFTYTGSHYGSQSDSNIVSVVIDGSALPSHYVTNNMQLIHDSINKRIYLTGLSSTLGIANTGAENIGATNAQLTGTISCTGLVFNVLAYWGTTDGGQVTGSWDKAAFVGSFTNAVGTDLILPVSGLTSNTFYYYTFRATNAVTSMWVSTSDSFQMLGAPVVTNAGGAVGIIAGNAKLKGGFLDHNRGEVTICWGLTDGGTVLANWDHKEVLGVQTDESFSKVVSAVYYPLTYRYRCFATNAYGFGWSAPVSVFSITNVPSSTAPPDGLLGQWTFDDETCNDSSVNGYHGEMVGGSYDSVDVGVAGGESINLTGGDYYVKVDTGGSQDVFDLDELSVSFWVKGWPDGSWEPMISKQGESAGYQVRKQGDSGNNIAWTLRGPGNDDWSVVTAVNDGNWHHVVATYGGGKRRLYVDNVKIGEEDRSGAINNTTDMLTFGARHWNGAFGYYSRIRLDDICIYNRSIEAEDVSRLFNSTAEVLVSITNIGASDITVTTAQMNAMFKGSNSAYRVWGYWNTSNGGTNVSAWTNAVDLGLYTNYFGEISFVTNGFSPGTTYWYTFRATNTLHDMWASPASSFSTVVSPLVNNGAGAVTTEVGVATLQGILTTGNYANIYIYWGTNDGVNVKGNWNAEIFVGGKFNGAFSAEVPAGYGKTYYYRCYASNSVAGVWAGSTASFVMEPPPMGTAGQELISKVPEAAAYDLVYEFNIPASCAPGWNNTPVVYAVDNSATVSNGSFERVAYYLEAVTTGGATQWVYVSMSAFTNNASKLGVPNVASGEIYYYGNPFISNANIYANVAGITSTTATDTVNLEFWPSNYGGNNDYGVPNANNSYDWGDAGFNGTAGHACMQIHNHGAGQVLFAYNAWGGGGAEFGIGSQPTDNPDYTFNGGNVNNYSARTLQILVHRGMLSFLNNVPADITANTATLRSTLDAAGRVFDVYAHWNTSDGGTNIANWTNSSYVGSVTNLQGPISCLATGLLANTDYYYTFRVTNDYTNIWAGTSMPFKTMGAPLVDNLTATEAQDSSVTLNGILTSGGSGEAIFCWGNDDGGMGFGGWDYTNNIGTVIGQSVFSISIPVLAGGKYYYRAYVTNSFGFDWANSTEIVTAQQATVSLSLSAALFAPSNLTGCVLWLDAGDIDGDSDTGDNPADGTDLLEWRDRSGFGHHADKRSGFPHYVTNGLNGLPVVRFTSSESDYLYTTYDFDALSKYSIIALARYTGGPGNGRVIASKTRNYLLGFHGGSEDRFHAEGWINNVWVPATYNWRLYAATMTDDANPLASLWRDGRLLTSNNGGSSDTLYKPGRLALGAHAQGNSEYSDCEVAEVLIYDRILSDAELNLIGAYLTGKYGLTTIYQMGIFTETNMIGTVTATLSAPAVSNVTVNINLPAMAPEALHHWGYLFNNDSMNNLDGNGGLLTATPYARVFLTAGPGGNGLYFANDQQWFDSGAIRQDYWDNYMNLIHGYLNVKDSGNHEFRIDWEDDIGIMWLDLDLDGVFEHAGANGDEQIIYDGNHSTVTENLTAGKSYKFAVTHREGGGGSGIRAWIKTPAMGSQARIKPTETAQDGLWTYVSYVASQGLDYTVSATSIVITAGSLSGSVSLIPQDDVLPESYEVVLVDIASVVNAVTGTDNSVVATLWSDDPEIVNSPEPDNITEMKATLYASLDNGINASAKIYYGTTDGGTTPGNWGNYVDLGVIAQGDSASVSLTGLGVGVQYYYRCYATNSSLLGEDWADSTATLSTMGPTASIADRSIVVERDTGTLGLLVTVTLTEASGMPLSMEFNTLDGTAVGGVDYVGTNGVLVIPAGRVAGQITIQIINDRDMDEPLRTFSVLLSNPVNCTISKSRADITILDNDAADYLSDWPYRVKINFCYDGSSTVLKWPAIVRLSTNITGFSYGTFASPTGGDLRFSTGDGDSICVYHVERWNTNGESDIWVQVPQLAVGNTNIWVYWGNTNETAAPYYTTNFSTWDGNYKGAWHFVADAADATENDFDGTISGAVGLTNNGVTANAINFPGGESDIIQILRPVQDDFSIEFWMQADGGGRSGGNWWDGYGLVDGDVSGTFNDFGVSYVYYNGYSQPCFGTGSSTPNTLMSDTAVNGVGWHHVAVTRQKSDGTKKIYVDGLIRGSGTGTTATLSDAPKLRFGKLTTPAYPFDGRMDEIRISDSVRSGDRIYASYTNQMPGSTFNKFGTAGARPSIMNVNGATNVTDTNAYLTANLISTGTASTVVWLYWGTNDGGQVASMWGNTQSMGTVTLPATNFSFQLNGLLNGTAYYYAYRATNAFGSQWAGEDFYTKGKPFVNNDAGAVGYIGYAELSGEVLSTGGVISTVYTYWGDNDGETTKTSWDYHFTNGLLPEGVFSGNTADPLVYGRQYYYRCYITNTFGWTWADDTSLFVSANPRTADGYEMQISFTNYIGDTLTNIPMLVVLGPDREGFSYDGFLSGQGYDLRFWDAARSNELNYEIENWNTNVNFKPTDISGCILWLDPWDIDGNHDGALGDPSGGQNVTVWKDKSLSGHTARLSINPPTVMTNGIGSGPVVRFTGQSMVFDSSVTANGSTVFAMFRKYSTDYAWARIMNPSSGTALNVTRDTGERVLDWNGAGLDIYSGIPAIEWHIQAMQLVAGANWLWVDTKAQFDASTSTFGPFGYLGTMAVDAADIIVYNRILTNNERIQVCEYLSGKYQMDFGFSRQGTSHVWVKIPELVSGNTSIWATWGNTNYVSKPEYTTNGATWTSGYKGVWHFSGTTATNVYPDSGSGQYNGTNSNAYSVGGKSAGALEFNQNGNVFIPAASCSTISNKVTISLWQYGDTTQPRNNTIFSGTKSGRRILQSHNPWGSGTVYWDAGDNGVTYDRISKAASATEYKGRWNYWTYTKNTDSNSMKIYLNGMLWHSGAGTFSMAGTDLFRIGSRSDGGEAYDGKIDEFRIANIEHSSNWIWACWMNMEDNAAFNTYGLARPAPMIENEPASDVMDISVTMNATVTAANAEYGLWVYWGKTDGGTSPGLWTHSAYVGSYTNVVEEAVSYAIEPGGLDKETTYYYTFYISNAAGESWAEPSERFYAREPMGTVLMVR